MSATPFDHPWLSLLLGDREVAGFFTAEAELVEMLRVEAALAIAEGAEGAIPEAAARAIAERIARFVPDTSALANATARDGVVVPELVRQLRAFLGPEGEHIHHGATSQDIVDTGLVLRLKPVVAILRRRLAAIDLLLAELDKRLGGASLMGRTRMQDALPISASTKIATWRDPLVRHAMRLAELEPRLLVLQFGGAVGTLEALGDKGAAVARRLSTLLGLGLAPTPWHSQRDAFAEFAGCLSLLTGSLGKIGIDIGLLAQMGEVTLSESGSSSAMPHKHNPVGAEVLVALARHNATLVSSVHHALVHEQERSGAAWTLEWLTLPQMVVAAAASLRTASTLLGSVTRMGSD